MIDIGANLAHDSFDEDRDAVLSRAREVGVTGIVVTGSSIESSIAAEAIAATTEAGLWSTAGIHPHHAEDFDDAADAEIRRLAEKPDVVAIGETGLDYFRDFSPRPRQAASFSRHLQIARELSMPLFLHQRDAHDDFLKILDPQLDDVPAAVVHCFTGTGAELDAYIERDLYVGITGWICDERRGQHLLEIVDRIPADRLLIETDAPYLLPRTIRPRPKSRRNEPCYLTQVAATVAAARDENIEEVARQTTENACRFFRISVSEA